jgi:hypothetical protein
VVTCFGDWGYWSTLDLLTSQSSEIEWWKRWTYYRSVQSLPLWEAILLTDQIDLCGGMKGESTTDRLDLSWPRRWTYYRSVQSSLVNDQSHKIQLEALSRLILKLVNQETGGFGPLVSSHWSSRSWIPSTERIHKPRNTTTHKSQTWSTEPVWHWGVCQWKNLLQIGLDSLFWGWIYYRSIQSYNLRRWTYNRSVQSPKLENKLINRLVWSY